MVHKGGVKKKSHAGGKTNISAGASVAKGTGQNGRLPLSWQDLIRRH